MKKILTIIFILICVSSYSQVKALYAVYLGCYTNGDTIPDDGFAQLAELTLLKDGEGQNEASIKTFNVFVYNKGKIIEVKQIPNSQAFADPISSPALNAKGDSRPQKIVIEAIEVEAEQNGQIVRRKLPTHTFYRAKTALKKCK